MTRERDGAGRQQQPQQHGSGIPHEHSSSKEVVRQEPKRHTDQQSRDQRRHGGAREVEFNGEQIRIDKEDNGRNHHNARRKPIKTINEVDGVDADDHDQNSQQHTRRRIEHDRARNWEPYDGDALQGHNRGRENLTGQLRRAIKSPTVVNDSERHDDCRGRDQRNRDIRPINKNCTHHLQLAREQ